MSFHELEIAIAPAKELKVISSLSTFNRGKYKSNQTELKRKYKSLLMDIHPHIHEGFFDETLYLIIEKRGLGAWD